MLQSYSKMSGHKAHLLDLPNEILFFILKKLENVDVLYSLLGINNQRLDIITQEPIFSKSVRITTAVSGRFSPVYSRFRPFTRRSVGPGLFSQNSISTD